MLTVFSTDHLLRNPRTELYGGELIRPHESPERAESVLQRVKEQGLGEIIAPERFGPAPLLRVHDPEYVEFLRHAWRDWVAAGNRGEAIPDCWPARRENSGTTPWRARLPFARAPGKRQAQQPMSHCRLPRESAAARAAPLRYAGRRDITRRATCTAVTVF